MRKLIYVSKGKIFDRYKRKYDIFVTFVDKIGEDVMPGGKYYDHDEFADYVREARPFGVVCSFASQDEFEYVIALFSLSNRVYSPFCKMQVHLVGVLIGTFAGFFLLLKPTTERMTH